MISNHFEPFTRLVAPTLAILVVTATPAAADRDMLAWLTVAMLADAEEGGEKQKQEEKKNKEEKKQEDTPKKDPAGEEKEKPAKPEEDSKKDKEKEKEAVEAPKKKKPPPVFHLHDGSRISGDPLLETLSVDTAYGSLTIPKEDLVRVRFAEEEDPELQSRVAAAIENLKSEEFETREQATLALQGFGAPALKKLRKALKSDDEEVKTRAKKLVEFIEEEASLTQNPEDEHSMPLSGSDDEVVTVKFVIRGKVAERDFSVTSKYGDFQLHRKDITTIVFQEFTPTELEFQVPANHSAPSNNWFVSKITLKKDNPLELTARGQIHLHNYGWTVGPAGTTNVGQNHFQNFPAAALVARIGPKGKPFLVGANFKGKANATGRLMLAIAYRGGSLSGSFTVKASVKPDDDDEEQSGKDKADTKSSAKAKN